MDDEIARRGLAEKLFNETVGRALKSHTIIWSLQFGIRNGYAGALELAKLQARSVAETHLFDPNFGTAEQRQPFVEKLDDYADKAAIGVMDQAQAAANAACIVFAHTILDGAAIDYCRVSALLDIRDWVPKLKKEKISLAELDSADVPKLMRTAADRYMTGFERESLLTKIEALQAVCKPERAEIMKAYKFDREKIYRIDQLRIAIVHKNELGAQIEHADDNLEYLRLTNLYLSQLITHRYGLLVDPAQVFAWTSPQPAL